MAGIVNEAYTLDVNVQEGGAAEASVNIRAWDSTSPTPVQRVNKTTDANGDVTSTSITAEIHSITATSTRATTVLNPIKIRALKWPLNIEEISINLSSPSKQTFFMSTNTNLTQTNQTTVNGYTGFSINHSGETITLNAGTWNEERLYDRVQSEAITNPQQATVQGQALQTVDGVNFTQRYEVFINGIQFDGNFASYNGNDWTIQGVGGNVIETTITGNLIITTADADLTDVTVNGNITVSIAGGAGTDTLNWTRVTCTGTVSNANASRDLDINATDCTITAGDPGTGPGQTNIIQSAQVELTGLIVGSEVRAYVGTDPATSVEIDGVETTVGTTFSFSQSEAGNNGYIVIFKTDYEDVFLPITYSASNQSIPVQQRFDRTYKNPV